MHSIVIALYSPKREELKRVIVISYESPMYTLCLKATVYVNVYTLEVKISVVPVNALLMGQCCELTYSRITHRRPLKDNGH